MSYRRSPAMVQLEALLEIAPQSIPELIDINPEVNWKNVIMNATQQRIARPNGDYHYTVGRKHKRYELVPLAERGLSLPPELTPACFPAGMFQEWQAMAKLAREPVTICADCQKHTPEYKKIVAEGRCHQSVWELRWFGNHSVKQEVVHA